MISPEFLVILEQFQAKIVGIVGFSAVIWIQYIKCQRPHFFIRQLPLQDIYEFARLPEARLKSLSDVSAYGSLKRASRPAVTAAPTDLELISSC